jgi:TonB family protein
MGLVTLLVVSLLGAGGDQDSSEGDGTAAQDRSEVEQKLLRSLIVDTSAVSPPLRAHGSLDPDKVREVVSAQRDALRNCYERGIAENPTLSGTCTLRIVVDRDGTVGLASMQGSSLHSLSMQRCVLQLARGWRFPAPADGRAAAIEYPLAFRRQVPDAGP